MNKKPHRCPGGCGRSVLHRLVACGDCWYRLPVELQQPILAARRGTRAHLLAVAKACDWYRENKAVAP